MLATRRTDNDLAAPLNAFRKRVVSGGVAGVQGNDDVGGDVWLIICDTVHLKGQLLPTQRFNLFLMAFDQIGIDVNPSDVCIELQNVVQIKVYSEG